MTSNPWFKFYPSDWRSDPALRICSIAARGLWIEMLGVMHEADPRGHLLVKGRPPTDAQLAVLTGTPPDQITDLLGELESADVFSRTQKGVIYSRRMTRDEKIARTARKNGKSGGNPSLCLNKQNLDWDNQPDNPQVKHVDKAQKPEARSQRPDKEKKEPSVQQKKGSRLPDDWRPNEHDWQDAVLRFGEDGAKEELAIFTDWWRAKPGKDGMKLDWDATWRVWIRNSRRQPKPREGPGKVLSGFR